MHCEKNRSKWCWSKCGCFIENKETKKENGKESIKNSDHTDQRAIVFDRLRECFFVIYMLTKHFCERNKERGKHTFQHVKCSQKTIQDEEIYKHDK